MRASRTGTAKDVRGEVREPRDRLPATDPRNERLWLPEGPSPISQPRQERPLYLP